jgi:hypothetical protein
MTDAEFTAWLGSSAARRCTLFEISVAVAGVETVRYLSNAGYVTGAGDVPAHRSYSPVVSGGLTLTESISLTAEAGMTAGDIAVWNIDGIRDGWLDNVWVNRRARAWVGDTSWPRADFRLIFDGIVADIGASDRNTLRLKLRDKIQRLNTPLTDAKLGGTTPNADSLLPLLFGQGHNITPLLIDPVLLTYQVHAGQVQSIFEVRDNGKPVACTIDNAAGTLTLLASPSGVITCSVWGDAPDGVYTDCIGALIRRLVTGYGKESDRFTDDDLDLDNFAAFDVDHPQPVGVYFAESVNVLIACQQLASSVGAQLVPTRAGLLQLQQISFPPAGDTVDIQPAQMLDRSLSIAARSDVVAAVKVGYCKNWTVQDTLLTSIPAQHKDMFTAEWWTTTATDGAVQAAYRLSTEPVMQETCLLTKVDADAEASRRLARDSVVRTTYRFDGTPKNMDLKIGQSVNVFNRRFGLDAGKLGVVTLLAPNWGNCHVGVEITV